MTTAAPVRWKKTLFISALVVLAAAASTVLIFSTEPTAVRGGATKQTAMLVTVTEVEHGTFRPLIVATGIVRPERDTVLSPRVDGKVVHRAAGFDPGRFVDQGETLVRIDRADYRNTLQQRQSDLRQALSELSLEMGRQDVAEQELDLVGDELSEEDKARVLRQPQLAAVRARVQAARAGVEQAKLDLRRTNIRAPFDGQILRRDVSLGSQVAPGDSLGRLVGVDTYRVVVTVPQSKVRWLSFPEDAEGQGTKVRLHNRGAWPPDAYRTGHLRGPIRALDEETRMVRLIVAIEDPLARTPAAPKDAPALTIGEFLEARLRGKEIPDVIRLDRDYVRDDDTVWVMEDGTLRIRDVEIVVRDERHAYISEGLDDDDRVVTTNLSTVSDGAPLRVQASGPEADGTGNAGTSAP